MNYIEWKKTLAEPLSGEAIDAIAILLAKNGYEPADGGYPLGGESLSVEEVMHQDVRGYLQGMVPGENYGEVNESVPALSPRDTKQWRADILSAATLVWAGAIVCEEEAVRNACPLASGASVRLLLLFCDLDRYWNRQSHSNTKEYFQTEYRCRYMAERGYPGHGRFVKDPEALNKQIVRFTGS